ncbi:DHA2 family efflux MFS transporter permease subunit [Paraburkholderia silviterrae]|uniref:DHA2 family efflux MFS transporter permease subunit n=1 Tax=Paraburkholderia silviterrae TaxID=2528715 RepID=A0A4R5M7A6_9BURK|nr:DHA2 family efflux MFS transporter permease subunit [Paraburkholderia silviterrae]TDG22070.1 DHA2 family efflux MFS transporter permease subunit [Paraburkholderia silviterrae]
MPEGGGGAKGIDSTSPDSPARRLDASQWKIISVATVGSLLAQLDATIVNVSLSSLAADLHTSLATIQWVTSGYLLTLTLVLPISGWLVDRIGAKAVYVWCFLAFTLASALCGMAWSASSLIAFRVLQGACGGLLAPMAQMIVARAAGKQMARVIGYMAVPVLAAPILGPLVAGAILQHASWRWLFLLNLPIGVLALVLAWRFLPYDRTQTRPRELDWMGLMLLSPALVLFLYGCARLGGPVGMVALPVSVTLLMAFLYVQRRKGDRALLDLGLFRGTVFGAVASTQFLSNGAMFAGQALVPMFLIDACGRSPGEMGWMLMPMGLGMLLTYLWMGKLTTWFGVRKLALGGALLALMGTLPFVWLAHNGLHAYVLAVALFLRGMGLSTIGAPSLSAAYASVERPHLPMATTTMNIVQRLGGPTWTTLCTLLLAWQLKEQAHAAQWMFGPYGWAFVALCAVHGLTCVATARLPLAVAQG